ncbi:MAG: ABC transporter permease subunit [Bacteroidales bacterium]|nr:ABC transporter permease subunit [Bacteroidales bacterium]MCF8351625.1 ABC transporter permease subunit [Bacteroidales bacterium]MCF8377542.1 ABC transporter permease subunit [Bacteroidales bacterium]MCF8401792.1 ABC transporter permease subunit [Bacteroidales bacterium]
MKAIRIIAKRELKSYFDSLMAYVMIVLFLGFTGFFTWLAADANIFDIQVASLQVFFQIAFWTLFFFIPALTMRSFAEEIRSGTIEYLMTKPVSDWQLVMGKYLSVFILIVISLLLTLPYYITVASIGDIDHNEVWTGYLGLLLMSAAYISIGIWVSSISNNQIVAILVALVIGILFQLIFYIMASNISGWIGNTLYYLSFRPHYESITRGVIDSKDIIYFLSIVFVGLLATELTLAKRKFN